MGAAFSPLFEPLQAAIEYRRTFMWGFLSFRSSKKSSNQTAGCGGTFKKKNYKKNKKPDKKKTHKKKTTLKESEEKKHLSFVVLIVPALKVLTKCLRNIPGAGPTMCQTHKERLRHKTREGKTDPGRFRREGTIPGFQRESSAAARGEVTPKFQSSRGISELLWASLSTTG